MHRGACMAGGMHDGGGHAWQWACVAGGVHGRGYAWWGACMAEVCMAGGHAWQDRWPLQRTVCILLEWILVSLIFVAT